MATEVDWSAVRGPSGGGAPVSAEEIPAPAELEDVVDWSAVRGPSAPSVTPEAQPVEAQPPAVAPLQSEDGVDWSSVKGPRSAQDFATPSGFPSLGPRGPAIPGLSISGGQITSLPESLPMEAPPALLANPGRLSRDDLNAALRRASVKYGRSRDIKGKVQALAEFIRDWDPDKADSLGITREGYVESKGLWQALDFIDVVFDRWLRVGGETLWEGKKEKAAAVLAGKAPETNLISLFKRNWEEDKGQLGKGSEAVKNWLLWATTPWGMDDTTEANEIFSRDVQYDVAEQDLADWMSSETHKLAGVYKGRDLAETQRIIEEAKAQGSPGAHMMLDLAGFMSVSSLNLIGLGPLKGAMSGVKAAPATKRLMGLGLKFNPLGNERMGKLELEAMSQARMSLVDQVAETAGAMEVGATVTKPAQRAAAQASIDATQAYVDTLRGASDNLTEIERGLEVVRAERVDLLGKADKVSEARLAELGVEAEALGARYNKWMTRFDEAFNDLSKTKGAGRISGKQLFGGIQARAITIATGEVANATNLALQNGIKSGAVGSRAAPLLSEATELARVEGMSLFDAQGLWVDAIKEGEKSKKVLVDLGLRVKGDKLVSSPTLLSPGEARVYENARNGAHGSEAAVAAYYPGKGALQKVMGKKDFARRAEEATDEIIALAAGKGYSSAGRRAIVKGIQKAKGTSKAELAFQADRMVTNVKPMGFALTHAIIKRFPWAEKIRHPIAGIASLSFNRPMKYATKGPDGKWVALEQNVMLHPSMHRRMTAEARQSLTTQAVLRAEWPVWRARLEAMSKGNAELLKVGRFAYEVGWASEEAALATLSDVSKLGAVEKVNGFIDKVSLAGKALKAGEGRTVQVLSDEDVSQVIESLRFLRENTALEGSFFDDIEQLVTKYAGRAGEVDADIALLGEAAATAGERSAFLEDLRIQANILYSAAHASVENRLSFQTNLAIGKMGSDLAPELDRLSKSLASVSEQLAAKKSAAVQTDASKQLDEAIAALAGEGARGEDILKSRDAQANAYKQSLEDFRRSVAAEFGDDVADEAVRGAEALTPPAAAAEAAGRRGAMSVEDVAQSYSESVSVAWSSGESVPIRSLFEASWDPVNNRIDATLLGARSTGSIKELNLPKGVQGAIEKLGKARRAIDEATVSLRVAEDIDAGVIGEKTRLAQKALTAAESKFNALLEVASKTVNRDPRFVPGQDKLLYEVGSDQRRILEALQLHYRNNIASITSQIATKAAELRASSREAMTSLVSQLSRSPHLKKSRVLSPGSKERLEKAITQLGESIFGRDVSIRLPAGKDVSADILLKQAVVEARKAKDPAERAAILQKEILNIEEKLAKVGDVVSESQLGKALAAFDVKRRAKKEILPTEVNAFARAVEDHVNEFLKQIDEATFDLRHPDDILRPIEDRITASYNHAETTRAVFNAKLKALRDADLAKLIPTLSTEEAARVSRLVKNPLLHNLVDGPDRLLKKFQTQLASAQRKLLRYEGEGVDAAVIEKQRQNVATLEEKIRIIGDPEDFERVLGVARIMKDFFDESFRRLKEAGVLDEAFSRDEFFARVDVGAYFPHMLSQAARKKLDAFGVGTGGRVGRSIMNYFSQNRQLAGTIEDINDFRRGKRAEQILFHAARNGHYGEGAAQAAADGTETLRTYLNSATGQSFDDFVREIEEGALLAEYDELFEADPLMVMEYYHRVTSEAVADAQFIDTILELFPAGRFLADLPIAVRDERAKDMGYAPLGEVEYLQAILQKQLPKGLKGLSKDLKARVVKGAKMDEIKALVRAELGEDVAISTDILTALTDPKLKIPYVPIPVREYLNWRNSADALLAKRTTSTEIWDGLQAWAKTQATIVALAHIGRNFIGNTISLLQEIGFGALNFDTQFTAMRIWGSWGDKHLDTVLKVGPHEMSVRDWRDFFSSRGFFDEALSTDFLEESVGFTAKEIPGTEQTAKLLAGTSAGALTGMALGGALSSLIPGAGPLGFFAGGALGLKAGKKWSGVKAVRGGGVYQKFVKNTVKDVKETPRVGIAKAGNLLTAGVGGAAIGSTFLGVGALPMAAISVATAEDFLKMMSGLNRAAESQARLSMAVGLLKRGEDLDTALVRVNKSLRDYSDLTPLEKNVFRRFFFFYTWEAGNIKYQLDWMKRNPATARGLAAFTNGVYQMQFTEEQLASIPEHYRYGVVVKSGAAKLIAISGLPWQPMLEVLTRSKEGMPIQGLLTRIHPAILTTMEMLAGGGTSFYYGKPIKELNNINQLKHAPPMVKIIFGYPEEPNYYAPVYKNGVKTGRTRAVRKSDRPVMYYLGQKLPGWRWMNQYMVLSSETFNSYALESALTPDEVEDARASRLEKGLMFSFGFKETAIDWEYQSYRMSKEMEERMLDMINNQYPMAVGERRYLRKRLSAEPSPTQMKLEE